MIGGKKTHIYIMLHQDPRGGGMHVCDRGAACSHPDPSAVLSATYIVVQCHRLVDYAFSGETRRAPPEAPISVKLWNQTQWSHFGE